MNQILYTSENRTKGPLPIKTVVRFFAIAIIVLGIIFIGQSAYSMFTSNTPEDSGIATTNPVIEFAKDGNNAVVSVSYEKSIALIKYKWNDGEEKIVRGNSEKEVVVSDINIPSGINTLTVTASADDGKSITLDHEYTYEGISIDLSVINNSDIKIVATDVTGLASLKYRWNNEEEIEVFPDEEGAITIEQLTPIPSGLNTLYIDVVNTSNLTLSKEQEVKGNKRPEISLYIDDADGNLYVTVNDDEGVDNVKQQINDGEIQTFEAHGEKEFTYKYYVGNEKVIISITATDIDGVSRNTRVRS